MTEQAPLPHEHVTLNSILRSWYRTLSRFAKLASSAAAAIAVAGFLVAVANFALGISLFQNPSERYRAELTKAAPIVDASYSLLARPGVTESLLRIPDIPQRRAAMEAIFTKYIVDKHLEGSLEQAVDTYDLIVRCETSWFCHIDDYQALKDQMINVWFSYAGKIRQMRGAATGSDFGVLLEQEAQRLRDEQKAKVG
ncbi:hypothetical protein FJW08_21260 [Mesorhizobium sp. B3-2-1]|uniref:hypothetical protein n=1 Tax=Mesorhizobium sp. B3-2-1 TaxID=2589891 RepID=UPI001125C98C|nr:hypothetical protein [Mesorhizobium sp. B3-2-1]TPI28306.1 hypothetical protein FJW08_21260 [Mesorhizobium sp. B3-2-1]